MTRDATTREAWSSRTGFLLASIGSAVGIGNLWRFPYVVGTTVAEHVVRLAPCPVLTVRE